CSPDRHRQRPGIFWNKARHIDRRVTADRDKNVSDDRHVQHFFLHYRAYQPRDLVVHTWLEREHRGQVGRDRAVLQFDRFLQPGIKIFAHGGSLYRLDDLAIKPDHGLSFVSLALNSIRAAVLPRVGAGSRSSVIGAMVSSGDAVPALTIGVPLIGSPSLPGRSIQRKIIVRLASDTSRGTGMC